MIPRDIEYLRRTQARYDLLVRALQSLGVKPGDPLVCETEKGKLELGMNTNGEDIDLEFTPKSKGNAG
jgi:hypothetical protein